MSDPIRDIPNPQDANEEYLDRTIDHAVDVRRFMQGAAKESNESWQTEDLLLALWLRGVIGRLTPGSIERNKKFVRDLRERRAVVFRGWGNRLRSEITTFAGEEARAERAILAASIPIKTKVKKGSRKVIRAGLDEPMMGVTFTEALRVDRQRDMQRITAIVRRGVLEGATVDAMMAEIAGTKGNRFTDGALAVNRRNTTTLLNTTMTHAVTAGKQAVWAANAGMIRALRWTAILDSRTSPICRARDGKFTPVGPNGRLEANEPRLVPPGARPPAHPNCRSWMVVVLDGETIVGDRKVVTMQDGTRVDFRKRAKQNGTSIATERRKFIKDEFGGPAKMLTYNDWLKRQPVVRQDEILGKAKGRLFREGGLTMDSYVDRAGNELTLKELADRRPSAFRKAGLDPDSFK